MHVSKLAWAIDQTVCLRGSSKAAAGTMAVASHHHFNCQQSGCAAPTATHTCAAAPSGWPISSSTNSWLQRTHGSSCSSALMTWRPWPAQVACQAGKNMCSSDYDRTGKYQPALPLRNVSVQHYHSYYSSSSRARSSSSSSRVFGIPVQANNCERASTSSGSRSNSSNGPRPPAASEIISTANSYIKHCVKLRESARYRQQQRRLLLVGATLLAELAEETSCLDVLVIFKRQGAAVPPGVSAQHVVTVTDTVMKKLTGLEEAAGVQVVAELSLPDYINLASWQPGGQQQLSPAAAAAAVQSKQLQRLLVLEGVQDPGNLGTLLRCAAAFGWDAVWLLPGCCDPFNDKALRASRGAALRWPLAAGTFQQLLAMVQQHNMMLLAAHPEADNAPGQQNQPQQMAHFQPGNTTSSSSNSSEDAPSPMQQQQQPVCLVLGTEGAGLSADVLAVATPLSIPMSGHMESLNVGVAGAILMFALSEGLSKLMGRLQQLGQLQSREATAAAAAPPAAAVKGLEP